MSFDYFVRGAAALIKAAALAGCEPVVACAVCGSSRDHSHAMVAA